MSQYSKFTSKKHKNSVTQITTGCYLVLKLAHSMLLLHQTITPNMQFVDLSLYQFSFGKYYEKELVWIRFYYIIALKNALKSRFPSAKWCKIHKAWYLPDLPAVRKELNLPSKKLQLKCFLKTKLYYKMLLIFSNLNEKHFRCVALKAHGLFAFCSELSDISENYQLKIENIYVGITIYRTFVSYIHSSTFKVCVKEDY